MMGLADFKVSATLDWEEPDAKGLHLCSGLRWVTEPGFSPAPFHTKHDIVQDSNPAEDKKWNKNCIKCLNLHSHTPIITTSQTDRGHRERGRNRTMQVLASPILETVGRSSYSTRPWIRETACYGLGDLFCLMKRCISFLIPRSVCEDPKYCASCSTEGISVSKYWFSNIKTSS